MFPLEFCGEVNRCTIVPSVILTRYRTDCRTDGRATTVYHSNDQREGRLPATQKHTVLTLLPKKATHHYMNIGTCTSSRCDHVIQSSVTREALGIETRVLKNPGPEGSIPPTSMAPFPPLPSPHLPSPPLLSHTLLSLSLRSRPLNLAMGSGRAL